MRRAVVLHLAGAAVSATLWGLATRVPFVPVAIVLSEALGIWFPNVEHTRWRTARHLARAVLFGGTWAAIGLLAFG